MLPEKMWPIHFYETINIPFFFKPVQYIVQYINISFLPLQLSLQARIKVIKHNILTFVYSFLAVLSAGVKHSLLSHALF